MKKKLLKKLASRIRKLSKSKGIFQTELAYTIGKDQQSVQRLEKGKINPTFYYLTEIAEGLGVSLKDMIDF